MNKVYITAYESISPIGINAKEAFNELQQEIPRITMQDKRFARPYFPIKGKFDSSEGKTKISKITLALIEAIKDKWQDFSEVSLFFATSTGGIKETEEALIKVSNTPDKKFPLYKNNFFYDVSLNIKNIYGNQIKDIFTFSTACSSVGHSILQATEFIKNGVIDKALVVGVDVLSLTTMIGFDSLKLISPDGTKPLTMERNGLSLGEGGAILLLEAEPSSKPIAELIAGASTSDGYHLTAPEPSGKQQLRCIEKALKKGSLQPQDIDYINAHGTGTPANDEIELNAIKSIFTTPIPVTSLKSFIGHTLGSSAIIEITFCLDMLKNNLIIQPRNLGTPIDNNYIPQKTLHKKATYFLKNAFGFGGNNVSLILKMLH